jgi:hypothetical protein
VAGLLLKQNIIQLWAKLPVDVKQFVQNTILSVIADPSSGIRSTMATLTTTIMSRATNFMEWPELIPVRKKEVFVNISSL